MPERKTRAHALWSWVIALTAVGLAVGDAFEGDFTADRETCILLVIGLAAPLLQGFLARLPVLPLGPLGALPLTAAQDFLRDVESLAGELSISATGQSRG